MANAFLLKPLAPAATSLVGGTLTAGSVDNLFNDYAGVILSGNCNGSSNRLTFSFDLGADTSIDALMIFGVSLFPTNGFLTINYATAAQGNFTGSYGSDGTPVPYAGSVGMTSGKGVSFWAPAAPVTARYIQIVYTAPAPGYVITLSRVVIGKRIQLARNYSNGVQLGVKDLGSLDFSARGALIRRRAAKLRTVGLTFSSIYKDEVEAQTKPLLEQIGNTEMIGLCLDPAVDAQRQNRCYYGPLVGDLSHTRRNAAAWEAKVNQVSIF